MTNDYLLNYVNNIDSLDLLDDIDGESIEYIDKSEIELDPRFGKYETNNESMKIRTYEIRQTTPVYEKPIYTNSYETPITIKKEEAPKQLLSLLTTQNFNDIMKEAAIKNSYRSYIKKRLSVTEDFCGCVKKSYYLMKNEEKDYSVAYTYSTIVTNVGNTIHDEVQKVIPAKYIEQPFLISEPYPIPISGRIDMVLNDKILVEIKTSDSKVAKPKKEHLKQASIYGALVNTHLKEELGCNLDMIQILYVVRGKVEPVIFNIEITDELINKHINFVKGFENELHESLVNNEPPSMKSKFINKDSCTFCYFKRFCY